MVAFQGATDDDSNPIRFSPDLEDIKPEEHKTIAGLNEQFDVILGRTSEDYGHAVQSVHANHMGSIEGTLTVREGLPAELAQGLFAQPGQHPVYIRLSTNAGDILPDAIALPRELALKVVEVDGARLPDAEGNTQDFVIVIVIVIVIVNGPVFQAPNPEPISVQPETACQDNGPDGGHEGGNVEHVADGEPSA